MTMGTMSLVDFVAAVERIAAGRHSCARVDVLRYGKGLRKIEWTAYVADAGWVHGETASACVGALLAADAPGADVNLEAIGDPPGDEAVAT
jgi:hypothetical protein